MVSGKCWIEAGLCDVSMVVYCIYMEAVVREANVRALGKGLELLTANGGWFDINQLLFADDTALVATRRRRV